MQLPAAYPQRQELNDEVHARPAEAMTPPLRLSYLVSLTEGTERDAYGEAVAALVSRRGLAPPSPQANHFSADLGPFRLKWERHTEFCRCTFITPGAGEDPFAQPAISAVPPGWVAALPGRLLVASHAALLPAGPVPLDLDGASARLFGGSVLVGSAIAGGLAVALTDFRIHADGFSRFLVQDQGMSPRQAGRSLQRLLEIDTYRMMALLALPVARRLAPELTRLETELAAIAGALDAARQADEPVLLERLTRLAAESERHDAVSRYRFSAAEAYWELVQRRVAELREQRIEGVQTLQEFTDRRVAPAMQTCRAVAARQQALAQRMARTTQLLSTRVDITLEQQNHATLATMNRRAQLQLRLQETVEGLSVAAISYYLVGLVAYLAKGLKAAGVKLDADLLSGLSLPLIAAGVALGVRQMHHRVRRDLG